jgi:hypothetical protein
MTAGTDTLIVPDSVATLIGDRALQFAFETIEKDPVRAAQIRRRLDGDGARDPGTIARVRRGMRAMPNLRYVPVPFGSSRGHDSVHPRARWTDQEPSV